jgi:hypothetical protein
MGERLRLAGAFDSAADALGLTLIPLSLEDYVTSFSLRYVAHLVARSIKKQEQIARFL